MSDTHVQTISFEEKLKSGYYTKVKLPLRKFGADERKAISDHIKKTFVGTYQQIQEEIDRCINLENDKCREINEQHHTQSAILLNEFRNDLIDNYGLTNNPKADKCYALAWSQGHSAGLHEVAACFSELKTLIE